MKINSELHISYREYESIVEYLENRLTETHLEFEELCTLELILDIFRNQQNEN